MPPVLWKELLVEIRHSLGRFLSITAIVALGTAFFAGIKASAPDMQNSADAYFDHYAVQDIQVYSTIGLDEEDVKAVKKLEGVEAVQPVFSKDYLTRRDNRQITVKLITFQENQKINQPRLVSGRMPQAPDECLIEAPSATNKLFGSYAPGDRIRLYSGDSTPVSDDLKYDTFIVVGTAYDPNYLSYEKGSSSIGSGKVDTFIYVPQDTLKADYFTEIDVLAAGAANLNTYGDAYFDVVEPVADRIESIADKRVAARIEKQQEKVDDARRKMNDSLDDARKKLNTGKLDLDNAKEQIESGLQEISNSEALLASSKTELDSGWAAWNSNKQKLDASMQQVNAGLAQIEQAQAQLPSLLSQKEQLENALKLYPVLNNGLTALQSYQAQYEDALRQLESWQQQNPENPVPAEILDLLSRAESQLDQAIADLTGQPGLTFDQAMAWLQSQRDTLQSQIGSLQQGQAMLDQLNQGIEEIQNLDAQKSQLEQALTSLNDGYAQLNASRITLENAQAQYDAGTARLNDAKAEITSGQKEYESGKAEYDQNLSLFKEKEEDARKQVDDAQKKIDGLDGQWIVLDRNSHYSYRDYESCAQRMDGIASIFPVFFFLVAALVCMTTMTRMVDEERNQLGTLKALGYSKWQIGAKYILYAGLAAGLGCILGCGLGMLIFPYIIFTAWNTMYNIESIRLSWDFGLIAQASLSVLAVIMAATLFSIFKELQEVPAQLMRPKAAKAGSKIMLERIPWLWRRMSFMQKVTLRNLFRYKKRFFMTVIGIAGCSALLVAGFGLNDSISDIVPAQFERIYHYDGQIQTDPEEVDSVFEKLKSFNGVSNAFKLETLPITVHYDKKDVTATLNIVENPKAFESFMSFHPADGSRQDYAVPDQGILLSAKTAEKLGVSKGDEMEFKTSEGQTVTGNVAGIFEQYIGHELFISQSQLNAWHLKEKPNGYIVFTADQTDARFESDLGNKIMELKGVQSITFFSSLKENFLNMISAIKMVVVVLVLSAAMLAFVVLYNLSNVNISERMREIATIKVLGFTERETNQYINRESLLLAVIGAVSGLFLGVWLHGKIMNLAELDTVSFGRTIQWQSFALSVVLTFIFALAVNWIMKFRLRKIEMVESLKAVE